MAKKDVAPGRNFLRFSLLTKIPAFASLGYPTLDVSQDSSFLNFSYDFQRYRPKNERSRLLETFATQEQKFTQNASRTRHPGNFRREAPEPCFSDAVHMVSEVRGKNLPRRSNAFGELLIERHPETSRFEPPRRTVHQPLTADTDSKEKFTIEITRVAVTNSAAT